MKKSPWSDPSGSKNRQRSDAADEPEDPLNPAIPKAPLIPHDIARMPNAALPIWSRPPDERGPARPTLGAAADVEIDFRDHVDARPPPGVTPSTYQSAAMPPHTDSLPRITRAAGASIHPPDPAPSLAPAASPRPTALERDSAQPGWSPGRWALLLAVAALLLTLAGLWLAGVLN